MGLYITWLELCYNRLKGEQKGSKAMATSERQHSIAADIRELRGIVIDLASRLGSLEWQMRAILALMLALLAVAITILIRVW